MVIMVNICCLRFFRALAIEAEILFLRWLLCIAKKIGAKSAAHCVALVLVRNAKIFYFTCKERAAFCKSLSQS